MPRPDSARPRPAPTVDQIPPKGFRQWHAVLGVPHDRATRESVKARYRKDALRLHPDKPGGSKVAFQKLQWAYATAMSVLDARERGEHVPELAQTA
jgi:DnaJ domain